MIKLVEAVNELQKNFGISYILTQIKSNMIAYAHDNSVNTWIDANSETVIQLFDKTAYLISNASGLSDEMQQFVKFLCPEKIISEQSVAKKMGLEFNTIGIIMKQKNCDCNKFDLSSPPFPEYSKIYSLLSDFSAFEIGSRESFIADLSLRIRNKTARIYESNSYLAVALSGFETDNSAIVSAVAVAKNMQKSGIGSAVLNKICSSLNSDGKIVFICRKQNENEHFYIKNGFENADKLVECIIKTRD